MTKRMKTAILACGVAVLGASIASASTITWGAATTLSDNTDVSVNGTLMYAYGGGNFDGSTGGVAVNGVTFADDAVADNALGSDISFALDAGSALPYNAAGNAGGLPEPYNTLVDTAVYSTASPSTFTFTLNKLTVGQQYELQYWIHDSRGAAGRTATLASGTNTVVLDFNTTDAWKGKGQYVIGTFTADAVTQEFTATAAAGNQFNAMQLRAVPEPATIGLFGSVGALMVYMRRRIHA